MIVMMMVIIVLVLLLLVFCMKVPSARGKKVKPGVSKQVSMVLHYEHGSRSRK